MSESGRCARYFWYSGMAPADIAGLVQPDGLLQDCFGGIGLCGGRSERSSILPAGETAARQQCNQTIHVTAGIAPGSKSEVELAASCTMRRPCLVVTYRKRRVDHPGGAVEAQGQVVPLNDHSG